MSKRLSILTDVVTISENEFLVLVHHDIASSYARTIDPRGNKAAHQHMIATGITGDVALVASDYGVARGPEGRYTSIHRYVRMS